MRVVLLALASVFAAGCTPCFGEVCGPGGVVFSGLPPAPRCTGLPTLAQPMPMALGSSWVVTPSSGLLSSSDPRVIDISSGSVVAVGVGTALLRAAGDSVRLQVLRPTEARFVHVRFAFSLLDICPAPRTALVTGEATPAFAQLFDAEGVMLAGVGNVETTDALVPAAPSLTLDVHLPSSSALTVETAVVARADRIVRAGSPASVLRSLELFEGDPAVDLCFRAMSGEEPLLAELTFESDTMALTQSVSRTGTESCVQFAPRLAGRHILRVSGAGASLDLDVLVRLRTR